MKTLISIVSWALLTTVAAAQAPQGPPKPGPELKRLSFYTGSKKCESTAQASSFGPAGTYTSTEHGAWGLGGFFIVGSEEFSGGGRSGKGVVYLGYDPERKVYTFHGFNSMGESEHSIGTVSGKTWTWKGDRNEGDKQGRMIITEDSSTNYSFKFESSTDGGKTWTTIEEGKCTKETPAPAAEQRPAK